MIFFTPVTCHPCETTPAAGECRLRVVLTHRMALSATTDRPLQAMSTCWGLLTPTHGCERLLLTLNPSSACEALLYCVPWRWVSCFPQTFFHRVSYALHVRLIRVTSNPACPRLLVFHPSRVILPHYSATYNLLLAWGCFETEQREKATRQYYLLAHSTNQRIEPIVLVRFRYFPYPPSTPSPTRALRPKAARPRGISRGILDASTSINHSQTLLAFYSSPSLFPQALRKA